MDKKSNATGDSGHQSSERLLRVVECLASDRLPKRLTVVSREVNLPKPTVLRYLQTLCTQGYAYYEEQTGCYALTWKICRISDFVKVNLVLRSMASSLLNSLANDLNASVCLVVATDYGTDYLDFVDNPNTPLYQKAARIGKNAPIHSTASGKMLLSAFPEFKVTEIIEKTGLERLTPNTITDKNLLLSELQKIRKCGYAIDNEECEKGYKCVSVPIYDYSGNVAAAISVTDSPHLLTDARIEKEVLPKLQAVAGEISYRMGFDKS